ncbi:hypothetical protein [Flavobacterium sp. UBA6046]|jgi:hypothetical protein|uniref:hypothetical protein n=1 Tax=Flavobacterium sp. UBA6046 TaxID=1946552 RepID=UPI0025C10F28|nr:hypothetical protein [Flavobacterium sp. UBA6046]
MKVIINTINIYNNVIINHTHQDKTNINGKNTDDNKASEADLGDLTPYIIINDNNDHPLIAQLEARILKSECDKKELIEKRNNENK